MSTPPGWYGKLPALGDFAARRVPDRFRTAWDGWLETGLALASRRAGLRWHALYLTFPVWRFAIPPGLIDRDGWVGVLLPSVDRVGRCYPLTLCRALEPSAFAAGGWLAIDRMLEGFHQAGLAALEADTVEAVEAVLAPLATVDEDAADRAVAASLRGLLAIVAPAGSSPSADTGVDAVWPLSVPLAGALADAAGHRLLARLERRALWWVPAPEGGGDGAVRLVSFPFPSHLLGSLVGLPPEAPG